MLQHHLKSALDYGCGKGKLADFLNSVQIESKHHEITCAKYDPAIEQYKSFPNGAFDLVISNDVFEHFHPDTYLEDIRAVRNLSSRGIFLNISCRDAVHHLPNGLNCHTLVKTPFEWLCLLWHEFKGFDLLEYKYNPKNKNLILFFLKP